MTSDQELMLRDQIALARIDSTLRMLRAVGDVLKANGSAMLLHETVFGCAATIEWSLKDMADRETRWSKLTGYWLCKCQSLHPKDIGSCPTGGEAV